VTIKTPAQQDVQALHRLRKGCVGMRTALCNQIRGLVGEYGLVAPKGPPLSLLSVSEHLNTCSRAMVFSGVDPLGLDKWSWRWTQNYVQ
jgi:hypothetical protein